MNISLFGAGLMGRPMARRLAETGHNVILYNRSPLDTETAPPDVRITGDATAALRDCESALLMLSDAAAIREVVLASDSAAELPGKAIIQMGTIAPQESRELHADITAAGASYLEAPLLGSIPEAKSGTLIIMVGGTDQQFLECQPLLRCLGPAPVRIGPVGHAAAMKLALNQLIASETAAFALSLGLVTREGIDPAMFMDILRDSALYAPTFDKKLARMQERDFSRPNFPTRHLLKDVDLFVREASDLRLNVTALHGVRQVIRDTIEAGFSEQDYSSLYNLLVPRND